MKQQHIRLQKGHHYTVQFKMHATAETRVYLKVGDAGPPYKEFYKLLFTPGPTPKVYSGSFTMTAPDDAGVEMAFHMGGQLAKAGAALHRLPRRHRTSTIREYAQVPEPSPPPVPNVLVNQVGYLPALAKIAIVKNARTPRPGQLLNAKGESVASGDDHPVRRRRTPRATTCSVADFSGVTDAGQPATR